MLKRCLFCLGFAALLTAAPASKLTIYDFNLPNIDGQMTSFAAYKGKVVLIVNVASDSSYTPQYAGLESLYEKYKQQGLVVLGFPSNDFGNEEPGNEQKIKTFCEKTYHVTFPMFSKVATRGDEVTPLFHFLTEESDPKLKGSVHWNFTKFLIGRDGNLINRFEANVPPDDPDFVVAVETALEAKANGPATRQTPPSPARGGRPSPRTRSRE
jgi:glutathione peroxidase